MAHDDRLALSVVSSLSAELRMKGKPLPSDLAAIVSEAGREVAAIASERDRAINEERLEQIRQGAFDLVVVRDQERPLGLIAFQSTDDEAMLRFGSTSSQYDRVIERALAVSIEALEHHGINSIASVFNWPQREAFVRAADSLGFARVDRVNMMRDTDSPPIRFSVPVGAVIVPWSREHLDTSARVLFDNCYAEDRVFHGPYRTQQGCLAYLEAVADGHYGRFLPRLSYMACQEGKEVGLLLTTEWPGTGIEVEELVVDSSFRGRGIATSLIGSLADANAGASNEAIVLSVTRSNVAAFDLYRRLGFKVTDDVTYFAYERRVRGNAGPREASD